MEKVDKIEHIKIITNDVQKIFDQIKNLKTILSKHTFKWIEGNNHSLSGTSKIITKTGKESWKNCNVIGNEIVPKDKIIKWDIKINKIDGDRSGVSIGIANKNINLNISNYYQYWTYNCNGAMYGKLQNLKDEAFNSGDIMSWIVDQTQGTVEIKRNGNSLGVFNDLPKNEDLIPFVSIYYPGDQIELID